MRRIRLTFGEVSVRALLLDNDTAKAFYEALPLAVDVSGSQVDLCGRTPVVLPYREDQVHFGWRDGDVNYNPEGGWLAVFHGGQEDSGVYGDQVDLGRVLDEDIPALRSLRGPFRLSVERD